MPLFVGTTLHGEVTAHPCTTPATAANLARVGGCAMSTLTYEVDSIDASHASTAPSTARSSRTSGSIFFQFRSNA